MAAPRKYDEKCRSEIHRLVNLEGKRAPEVARMIRTGLADVPAQSIPDGTVKAIAREERGDISDRPKTEQLQELTGLAVKVIHDGFARQQAKNSDADADDTLKLVRSLRELEPLLTDKPQGKDGDKPASLLGGLSVVPTETQQDNAADAAALPVSAHTAS